MLIWIRINAYLNSNQCSLKSLARTQIPGFKRLLSLESYRRLWLYSSPASRGRHPLFYNCFRADILTIFIKMYFALKQPTLFSHELPIHTTFAAKNLKRFCLFTPYHFAFKHRLIKQSSLRWITFSKAIFLLDTLLKAIQNLHNTICYIYRQYVH